MVMEYMEGEMILEFGVAMDMIVCGMQFKKDDNKIVTCSLHGSNAMVDVNRKGNVSGMQKQFLVKKQYRNTI